MKNEKLYLASADVATRARCIESSYRTKDGRFIITENALRDFGFQMTAEEFVTGLDVTMVTEEEAKRLIAEGGHAIGPVTEAPAEELETPEEVGDPEEQELSEEAANGDSDNNEEEE